MSQPTGPAPGPGRKQTLNGLHSSLEKIEAPGSFSAFAASPDVSQMGLVAKHLYGKGSETIVDTSVRNTWELDASQVEFRHPGDWAKTLRSCVDHVGTLLGITSPGSIIADPYKMLIYETGAMFKAHTDTEKIPGMFGTLVFCLPSPHEGGDLVVKHRGQTETYRTSDHQPSVLAWYSDIHHEVLPVTSGYRWVLTYNLALPPDLERPSAGLLSTGTEELRHALRRWLEYGQRARDDEDDHLYYVLDHEYTEASISLNALKTTDLALLERKESGEIENDYSSMYDRYDDYYNPSDDEDWHELEDAFELETHVKRLVDLDGRRLRSSMPIVDYEMELNVIPVGADPFEGVNDRDEDYEGYMGNSGPSATHWYRSSVAVLVPRGSVDKFLTRDLDSGSAQGMVKYYIRKCSQVPESRASALQTLRKLTKIAWAPGRNNHLVRTDNADASVIYMVLKTALKLREYSLFNDIMGWVKAQDVDSRTWTLVKAAVGAGLLVFDEIKESLVSNLLRRTFQDRAECLSMLLPQGEEGIAEIKSWAANVVDNSRDQLTVDHKLVTFEEADGAAIADMVRCYQDYEYFKTRLVPIIEKKSISSDSAPFALAAIQKLIFYSSQGVFPALEGLELAKALTKSLFTAMDIPSLRTKDALAAEHRAQMPRYGYGQSALALTAQFGRDISASSLSNLFSDCIAHSWDDLLMGLSLKIAAQSSSIPIVEFNPLWLPFLHKLLEVLAQNAGSVPLDTPRYQQLFLAVLESYLDRYVGKEPSAEVDWSLPLTSCNCADCAQLNHFLGSATRTTTQFPVAKRRRLHLHQKLDGSRLGGTCTHETKRNTNPNILVVTKRSSTSATVRAAWEARANKAQQNFGGFDDEGLRIVLGADYERITGMERLRTGAPGRAMLPLNQLGQDQRVQGQSSVAGDRLLGVRALGLLGTQTASGGSVRTGLGSVAGIKRRADEAGIDG